MHAQVRGILHLPGRRSIITCSEDGSLRLWDLESGAQIGKDWREERNNGAVFTIALSPNGDTVASGSDDGNVRLWDVETGEVIAKWTGHTDWVRSVCWGANGQRVVSGSDDGTARVWDVKRGNTVLTITTGSQWVLTAIYSPNSTKIATGVHRESGVKIWDSKTGELLATLKHDYQVWSVVSWTSDGERLVSASYGSVRIFDTATWRRIAILEGGTFDVYTLCLSRNGRLLASAPDDQTVHLWNLNKSIPVGPPLQHEGNVRCAAFSADGKLLVTGCDNNMVYVWDIYDILKQAGFEDLLSLPNVVAGSLPRNNHATRHPTQLKDAHRGLPGFFDGVSHSSTTRNIHHRSPARSYNALSTSFGSRTMLFGRLPSLFRHSRLKTDEATELQQHPKQSIFSGRSPFTVEVATVQDRKPLAVAPRPGKQTQQQHRRSQAQASLSLTQPAIPSTSIEPAPGTNMTTPDVAIAQSRPIPLWARLVLFLCCASPPHANGH